MNTKQQMHWSREREMMGRQCFYSLTTPGPGVSNYGMELCPPVTCFIKTKTEVEQAKEKQRRPETRERTGTELNKNKILIIFVIMGILWVKNTS